MGTGDRADPLLDRRGFLGWLGKGAAVVALGGTVGVLGRQKRIPRPPRAKPEEEFLSLCTRCDACRLACPYGLIRPVSITESIINAGTPRLPSFWCRNCGRCIRACTTGALG